MSERATYERLAALSPTDKQNPEELGHYYQGDILMTDEQERNGLLDERYRWPDGTVFYEIEDGFICKIIT